jgi:hypothetical protein
MGVFRDMYSRVFQTPLEAEVDFWGECIKARKDLSSLVAETYGGRLSLGQVVRKGKNFARKIEKRIAGHPYRLINNSEAGLVADELAGDFRERMQHVIEKVYRVRVMTSGQRVSAFDEQEASDGSSESLKVKLYDNNEHLVSIADNAMSAFIGACIVTSLNLVIPVARQLVPGLEPLLEPGNAVALIGLSTCGGVAFGHASYVRNHYRMPDE